MPPKVVWLKARCPVCGSIFEYIEGGYKPKTCKEITCLHRFLHDPQYRDQPLKDSKLG